MRAKKKQLQRQTEAQKTTEQTAKGWRQTPWPSKTLAIICLICLIGFITTLMVYIWSPAYGSRQVSVGYWENNYDYITRIDGHKDNVIQLLMIELGWPVAEGSWDGTDTWWDYCKERLGYRYTEIR